MAELVMGTIIGIGNTIYHTSGGGGGSTLDNVWDDPPVDVAARYTLNAGWTYEAGLFLRVNTITGGTKYVALVSAGFTDPDVAAGVAFTMIRATLEITNFVSTGSGRGFIASEVADSTSLIQSNGTYVGTVTLNGASQGPVYIGAQNGTGTVSFDVVNIFNELSV